MSEITRSTISEITDPPVALNVPGPRTLFVIPVMSAFTGLWLGGLSGTIAGTGIFPVYGTIVGLALGAIGGLIIGFVLGPFYAVALARNSGSIRNSLTAMQLTGFVGSALVLLLGVGIASLAGQAETAVLTLVTLPALMVCAAWTGNCVLRFLITKDQALGVKQHLYGFRVTLGLVALASVAVPALAWIVDSSPANG